MTGNIERLTSALSDRYTIQRELGAGGMATVYLAQDIRHDRKVALKVLKPELAAVIGAERFLHEIKTTANLQHPHILPLFDSGEADSYLFYVMPYVEGESLRDLLRREKQLGIDQAVELTRAIAAALDYAHRRRIIHRDIKPENILLHDGQALVADFGIALAVSQAGATRLTETGLSIGTPQYMSPEQAMGDRELDPRSDVYSLGAMLFEMLTGDPPYLGSTAQAIVAKVITETPPLVSVTRPATPPHVVVAVQKALAKLPADRFHSAAEFAEAIAGRGTSFSLAAAAAPSARRGPPWRWPILAAGLLTAAVAGWAIRAYTLPSRAEPPVRFAFSMGRPGQDRPYLALSPDGRRIAMASPDSNGTNRIVVRDLESTTLSVIAGSEGAWDASFSPDGQWLAFINDTRLMKVPARGGPATQLAIGTSNAGTAWTPDGNIVFAGPGGELRMVSGAGGTPTVLTTVETSRPEFGHWYPQVLPAGNAVIFTSYSSPIERSRIEAYDLKARRRVVLVEGAVFGRYAGSGHLLYVKNGALFAVAFDAGRLQVRGTERPVLDDVVWVPNDALAGYAIAPNGTLVYLRASEWHTGRLLTWVDRSGREIPLPLEPAGYDHPRISPDGRRVAITVRGDKPDVRLFDLQRQVLSPLTRAPAAALAPVWTPDSRSVVYIQESPVYDLYRIGIDGSREQPVVVSQFDKTPGSISRAGLLAFGESMGTHNRLMVVALDGSGPPRPLGDSTVHARHPELSPDGQWVAFSERAPQPEISLMRADGTGGRRQISVNGGAEPLWTREGREIVYRKGNTMMAVSVGPSADDIGRPEPLFTGSYVSEADRRITYDVAPDGSRFLMVKPLERAGSQPVVVVLNWFEELRAKLGK